jgi:RNA polymerase sigma-70 factor (ECF subfamily)
VSTESEQLWSAIVDNRERAVRVAMARCARRDDVDDCVQEAITRVAGMKDVDVDRVGPLLTAVVSNLAADRQRARGVALRHQHRVLSTPVPAPEDQVCEAAEARWLWAQRAALPEQDRRAFELRAQGRGVAEVARELGITYKAAENALSAPAGGSGPSGARRYPWPASSAARAHGGPGSPDRSRSHPRPPS